MTRRPILVAAAVLSLSTVVAPHAAAAADLAAVQWAPVGQLPAGVQPAPLASAPDAAQFSTTINALRQRGATQLSKSFIEERGPLSAADQRRLGQSTYLTAEQVNVYAIYTEHDGLQLLTAPAHVGVDADGNMYAPAPNDNGLGAPVYNGPWGTERISTGTIVDSNDDTSAIARCFPGTVIGENRSKYIYRRLSESNSSYDYYGVNVTAVAEITQRLGNCISGRIKTFSIGMRGSSGLYLEQDPLSDFNSGCTSDTFTVSGTFAGIGASLSQSTTRCEYWDVAGGNAASATTWYTVKHDAQTKAPQSREAAALAVVRVTQAASPGFVWSRSLSVNAK